MGYLYLYLLLILQMEPDALWFRVVRPRVRVRACGRVEASPTGLLSTYYHDLLRQLAAQIKAY